MPPLLRKRFDCFYCGKRNKSQPENFRRWTCECCTAVNFRDENGEIDDVPPEVTEPPRQFARLLSPNLSQTMDSSIFCSNCLKNQYILNETLSNYLPSQDDPAYSQFEARLPAYRKELEDRYPQVCAECEPRVRERLQQAGYHAKADHIRRVMERSRARQVADTWGWRSLVIKSGGILYWTSFAIQLLWHAMGALTDQSIYPELASAFTCFEQLLSQRRVAASCPKNFGALVGYGIAVGILCAWWNPSWQQKLNGREGKMVGLRTYYLSQTAILILRGTSWLLLKNRSTGGMWLVLRRPLHAGLLFVQLISTLWSMFFVIGFDVTPLVNWNGLQQPLVTTGQYVPPSRPPRASEKTQDSFPVESLASGNGQFSDNWRPPTPPEENEDAMEWEHTSSLQVKNNPPVFAPRPQPSPFHGTLPPAPTNRLLHPHAQYQPKPPEAIGLVPGFFDKPKDVMQSQRPQTAASPQLAQPKFFLQGDRDADTGLENMFEQVFSIQSDKSSKKRQTVQQGQKWQAFSQPNYGLPRFDTVMTCVCGANFLAWLLMSCSDYHFNPIKLLVFALAIVICLSDLASTLFRPFTLSTNYDLLLFSFELITLSIFGMHRWSGGYADGGLCDVAVFIPLCVQWWSRLSSADSATPSGLQLAFPAASAAHPVPPVPSQELQPRFSHEPWSGLRNSSALEPFDDGAPTSALMPLTTTSQYQQWPPHLPFSATSPPAHPQTSTTRPRTYSIDSSTSSISTSSATTATTAAATPNLRQGKMTIPGRSPGFELGQLQIEDALSPFGPRTRRQGQQGQQWQQQGGLRRNPFLPPR